jgi:N-acetyl-anhydromuramyl-L-alanine amidase AmpD
MSTQIVNTNTRHEPTARFPWKALVNGIIFSHCQTQEHAEQQAARAVAALKNYAALREAECRLRDLRRSDFDTQKRNTAIDAAKAEIAERRNRFAGIDAPALLKAIS